MESKKKECKVFQEKDKMIHIIQQKGGVGAFIFCWQSCKWDPQCMVHTAIAPQGPLPASASSSGLAPPRMGRETTR